MNDETLKSIKKIFSEKTMDELPLTLVNDVYNELIDTYKTPIAGLIGVYLLGSMNQTKDS